MNSIGIIGSGRWGRNIARSFSKKRSIKRVVSTGNANNINMIKSICPNIIVSSMDELLCDGEIDAVIIAVPIESLAENAIKCLVSKKHIFLEKPAASNNVELTKIQNAVSGHVCFVNYLYLSDPSYESFKNAVMKTDVKTASFSWKKWGSFDNDILLNLASHDLSMALDSLGYDTADIDIIRSSIKKDTCNLTLNIGNAKVYIDIDRTSKHKNKTVSYETADGLFMWTPGLFAHEEIEVTTNVDSKLLDIQRDTFLAHVRNNTGYNNLGLSGKILQIIDEVRQ